MAKFSLHPLKSTKFGWSRGKVEKKNQNFKTIFSIEEMSLHMKKLSEENVYLKAQLNEVLGRLTRFETSQTTIIELLSSFYKNKLF